MAEKKDQAKAKLSSAKDKAAAELEKRAKAVAAGAKEQLAGAQERLEEAGAKVRETLEAVPSPSELVADMRGEKTAQLQATAAEVRERAKVLRGSLEAPGEDEEFLLFCRTCGRQVQGPESWVELATELEVMCIEEQGPCTSAAGQQTGFNERVLERSVVELEPEPA